MTRRMYALVVALIMLIAISVALQACGAPIDNGGSQIPDGENNEVPGGEDPEVPGGEDPEVPGGEDPEVPGGEDPEVPGGEDPEVPGGEDPEVPGGEDPEVPGGEDPEVPGGEDPEVPGGEDPEVPGGEDPEVPGGEDPEVPGGEDPEVPGGEDPEVPGGEDPEVPGGEDLEVPGGEDPEVPGGEDPNDPNETERTEPRAPSFTIHDENGNEVSLSDYIGKPIVLNFWATWCPPCRREMPEFQKMYEELYGEVVFLMVNVTYTGETVSGVKEFLLENEYTFTVLYDTYGEASDAYGIEAYPTTYFIDKDGYLIARAVGAISLEVLKSGIDLIT